jgi:hypothetical protein
MPSDVTDAPRPRARTRPWWTLEDVRWPEVIAGSLCVVGGVLATLYFHSYEPKAFSDVEMRASRARAVENCGQSMFDVPVHSVQCPAFDAISIEHTPSYFGDNPAYRMTIRADGSARLVVSAPEADRGVFEARVSHAHYRRLANLLGALALDRRGGYSPPPPDAGQILVEAGCGDTIAVFANHGGELGEVDGYARCFEQVKSVASWDRLPDAR